MKRVAFGVVAGLLGLALPACGDPASQAAWSVGADAVSGAPDEALWRPVDPRNLFIFETTKGRILIEAFPDIAPKHYAQFSALIHSGDLDGTTFHRVIDDFMAQGGDVWAKKGEDPGWPGIPGEFTIRRDVAKMPLEAAIGQHRHGWEGFYRQWRDLHRDRETHALTLRRNPMAVSRSVGTTPTAAAAGASGSPLLTRLFKHRIRVFARTNHANHQIVGRGHRIQQQSGIEA